MRVWGLVLLGTLVSGVALYVLERFGWRGFAIDAAMYAGFVVLIGALLGEE